MRLPNDLGWPDLLTGLDERGYAVLPGLLGERECRSVAALYPDEAAFRSRVIMARHNFGRGEYKYLRYPLPSLVAELAGPPPPAARAARQSLARAAAARAALSGQARRLSRALPRRRA